MITTGAQEAMAVLLAGLFDPAADALLVSDPCYIGITGLARLLGVTVIPIASDEHGCGLEQVALAAGRARRQGLRARVLYLVPDFNNPLGCSLPIESRRALLDLAERENLLILEDNPYGMFCYEGERLPTLKSLDREKR